MGSGTGCRTAPTGCRSLRMSVPRYPIELPLFLSSANNRGTVGLQYARLGEFSNNTAHSMGVYGLRIFPEYYPRASECTANTPPIPATFHNSTSYMNGKNGVTVTEGGFVRIVNWALIGNAQSGVEWQGHVLPLGYSLVADSLVAPRPRWVVNETLTPPGRMGVWTGAFCSALCWCAWRKYLIVCVN